MQGLQVSCKDHNNYGDLLGCLGPSSKARAARQRNSTQSKINGDKSNRLWIRTVTASTIFFRSRAIRFSSFSSNEEALRDRDFESYFSIWKTILECVSLIWNFLQILDFGMIFTFCKKVSIKILFINLLFFSLSCLGQNFFEHPRIYLLFISMVLAILIRI